MGYNFTPVGIASIKKSTNNKCWRRCGEKGALLQCSWECNEVHPLWRTVWRFQVSLWVSNTTPGQLSRGNHNLERYMHPKIFTIANTWKQPKYPSTDEWIKKMWYTHTYTQWSIQFSSVHLLSHVWLFATPWIVAWTTSPTPGVHSNSRLSSPWCHLAISSSVLPFSSCPQSLPASESFSHEVAKILEFQL